ncbi:unnamed protein product [Caenorhabditis auriculariae]|uniref:Calponin-homology (CH) domain-containing protein n=1 Tax=Caenorhabditis auriculariae TaxID=2777116 RepID=A0A8S1H3U6_9PELO|nr:unnamed protein product [Caenorhabditis auriculariae]
MADLECRRQAMLDKLSRRHVNRAMESMMKVQNTTLNAPSTFDEKSILLNKVPSNEQSDYLPWEEKLQQQMRALSVWCNSLLRANDSMEEVDLGKTKKDACRKIQNMLRNGTAQKSLENEVSQPIGFVLKQYLNKHNQDTLRDKCARMVKDSEIKTSLDTLVSKDVVGVRDDCSVYNDLELQTALLRIFLSFHPAWLHLALETVFSCRLEFQPTESITKTLSRFIMRRLFSDPTLLKNRKFAQGSGKPIITAAGRAALHQHFLRNTLLLLYVIETSHRAGFQPQVPRMFIKSSPFKSLDEIFAELSREVLSGSSQPLKKLYARCNFVPTFVQSFIDDYDYRVVDFGDLSNGIVLGRLVELVLELPPGSLTSKLRNPNGDRLRKLKNVEIVLHEVVGAFSSGSLKGIKASEIVGVQKESILVVLWHLVGVHEMTSRRRDAFRRESQILPSCGIAFNNHDAQSNADFEATSLALCRQIGRSIGVEVPDLGSLRDGNVLSAAWTIYNGSAPAVQFYPGRSLFDKIVHAADEDLGIPRGIDSSLPLFVQMYLSRLFSIRRLNSAACTIQRAVRNFLHRKKYPASSCRPSIVGNRTYVINRRKSVTFQDSSMVYEFDTMTGAELESGHGFLNCVSSTPLFDRSSAAGLLRREEHLVRSTTCLEVVEELDNTNESVPEAPSMMMYRTAVEEVFSSPREYLDEVTPRASIVQGINDENATPEGNPPAHRSLAEQIQELRKKKPEMKLMTTPPDISKSPSRRIRAVLAQKNQISNQKPCFAANFDDFLKVAPKLEAIIKIQAHLRGYLARKRFAELRAKNEEEKVEAKGEDEEVHSRTLRDSQEDLESPFEKDIQERFQQETTLKVECDKTEHLQVQEESEIEATPISDSASCEYQKTPLKELLEEEFCAEAAPKVDPAEYEDQEETSNKQVQEEVPLEATSKTTEFGNLEELQIELNPLQDEEHSNDPTPEKNDLSFKDRQTAGMDQVIAELRSRFENMLGDQVEEMEEVAEQEMDPLLEVALEATKNLSLEEEADVAVLEEKSLQELHDIMQEAATPLAKDRMAELLEEFLGEPATITRTTHVNINVDEIREIVRRKLQLERRQTLLKSKLDQLVLQCRRLKDEEEAREVKLETEAAQKSTSEGDTRLNELEADVVLETEEAQKSTPQGRLYEFGADVVLEAQAAQKPTSEGKTRLNEVEADVVHGKGQDDVREMSSEDVLLPQANAAENSGDVLSERAKAVVDSEDIIFVTGEEQILCSASGSVEQAVSRTVAFIVGDPDDNHIVGNFGDFDEASQEPCERSTPEEFVQPKYVPPPRNPAERSMAALRIQKWWRGVRVRRAMHKEIQDVQVSAQAYRELALQQDAATMDVPLSSNSKEMSARRASSLPAQLKLTHSVTLLFSSRFFLAVVAAYRINRLTKLMPELLQFFVNDCDGIGCLLDKFSHADRGHAYKQIIEILIDVVLRVVKSSLPDVMAALEAKQSDFAKMLLHLMLARHHDAVILKKTCNALTLLIRRAKPGSSGFEKAAFYIRQSKNGIRDPTCLRAITNVEKAIAEMKC